MSDKLSVHKKEDIPKIVDVMFRVHGTSIVEDIIDGLLNHYNHELLIDTIKNKVHIENKERQEFFIVGLDVYMYKFNEECSMGKAKSYFSEKVGIKVSTIETHLDNFRKKIREDIERLESAGAFSGYSQKIKDVEEFINDFIATLNNKYKNYNYDIGINVYTEPERKKTTYNNDYKDFLESINETYNEQPIPY